MHTDYLFCMNYFNIVKRYTQFSKYFFNLDFITNQHQVGRNVMS